jgi:threonine aldolase
MLYIKTTVEVTTLPTSLSDAMILKASISRAKTASSSSSSFLRSLQRQTKCRVQQHHVYTNIRPKCEKLYTNTFHRDDSSRIYRSRRTFTAKATSLTNVSGSSTRRIVDLRSDTVTSPSYEMLQTALQAKTGDDVMNEDPTIQELEQYMANLFNKECGLYVPTSTMANLIAIMAHCNRRSAEILMGAQSHTALWEAGNASGLAGVFPKFLNEDTQTGRFNAQQIRDLTNIDDNDVHACQTQLLCLENTHNMLGGIALPVDYMNEIGTLCRNELNNLPIHLDGARICNAATALNVSVQDLCNPVNTVAICLSKGLGAPLGSVLVGDSETIRLAKRARKRCGGGMRQAGVVAAMGLYAIQNNHHRLVDDHVRAQRLASTLAENGFRLMRQGKVDTNIVYFQLPDDTINRNLKVTKKDFCTRLLTEYGVKVTGGYSSGGNYFRAVTHLDVNDDDVDRAAQAMIQLCYR